MPLSWNEIRQRAVAFSRRWREEERERAEAQTFWNEFFNVFGLDRRHVAVFEERVQRIARGQASIDLIWKGQLIAEHKSRREDLSKAASQAYGYIQDLITAKRYDEVPRYIVVSDFERMALYDLEPEIPGELFARTDHPESIEFDLKDFSRHVHLFGFILGYQSYSLVAQDPINVRAVEKLGRLRDELEKDRYTGHKLERVLVRVLFCLFADDTGLWLKDAFHRYLLDHTGGGYEDVANQPKE